MCTARLTRKPPSPFPVQACDLSLVFSVHTQGSYLPLPPPSHPADSTLAVTILFLPQLNVLTATSTQTAKKLTSLAAVAAPTPAPAPAAAVTIAPAVTPPVRTLPSLPSLPLGLLGSAPGRVAGLLPQPSQPLLGIVPLAAPAPIVAVPISAASSLAPATSVAGPAPAESSPSVAPVEAVSLGGRCAVLGAILPGDDGGELPVEAQTRLDMLGYVPLVLPYLLQISLLLSRPHPLTHISESVDASAIFDQYGRPYRWLQAVAGLSLLPKVLLPLWGHTFPPPPPPPLAPFALSFLG